MAGDPTTGADAMADSEETVPAEGAVWEELDRSPAQPTNPASNGTSAVSLIKRQPCDMHYIPTQQHKARAPVERRGFAATLRGHFIQMQVPLTTAPRELDKLARGLAAGQL